MLKKILALSLAFTFLTGAVTVYARPGDLSFFGGISEGSRLPSTTETLLAQNNNRRNNNNNNRDLVYKEIVFLTGVPVTFEGLLRIRGGSPGEDSDLGTFTETHTILSSPATPEDITIARNIQFDVNYRRVGNQIIKDYTVRTWTETITIEGRVFTLDPLRSSMGVTIIQDRAPAVLYYRGDISKRAVFTEAGDDDAGAEVTTLEMFGQFYGFDSAWSRAETHRLDATVFTSDWQMQYQIRPSVSMSRTLQYHQNEPTAISFVGNYREVMQNNSGLEYNIFVKPNEFFHVPDTGRENIATFYTFEQLIAPDLEFLRGHFAESDIRRLFSMEVLQGDPRFFQPHQAITRGQFVTALVRAMNIPVPRPDPRARARRNQPIHVIFPDVSEDRPEFPYIMAAFESGVAIGRLDGNFSIDAHLPREEAVVIMVRALGLENLGLDPTPVTSFMDDYRIAPWARRDISAAERIGLISHDTAGNFRPREFLTNAEAAALLNRLIDYMRTELALDYTERIVNFPN